MTRARPVRPTLALAPALALAVTLTGCLEREERVVVHADGALDVVHVLRGDAADLEAPGDALPTPGAAGPWLTTERDQPKADGKGTERVREARARFARAAEVPAGFGAPGDPAPLAFTTALTVERLADGATRYTFERRYAARALAWRQGLFERHLPEALRRRLEAEKPPGEPLKREALAGLLAFERAKGQALLEQALAAVAPDAAAPAAARAALAARAAYGAAFDAAWRVDDVLELLGAPAERKAALEARYRAETLAAAVRAGAAALEAEGLAGPGAGPPAAERVRAALEQGRRVLEATEDLQDERFVVRVTLPGAVTLSDAEALEDGGRRAVFRFGGADLADRPVVLRAVALSPP